MSHLQLPLRTGVGVIVLNQNNEVFVAKRKDNPVDKWQMPQGGVEKNELLLDAMRRELYEETSIKNIEILKEIDKWFQYNLPEHLLGKIWKGKYRGQKQKWFIVKFLGQDKDINLETISPEFIEWKWIQKEKLPSVVVDFKKHIYKELLTILKIFID
ncbi:RNA pyrophosphohydrolase [Pelagibacteraceae bacterium]|mgnify:CR=1 FL=1|jgi:putative (di)nucleoside polyphosphate hydrolase|nr:RNA pyrophosphohydrolase [Pelagibacteraceae bacterium]